VGNLFISLSISWLKINTNQDFTYGTGIIGSVILRNACTHYLNKHFDVDKNCQVKPEHIIMGTGLITILPVIAKIVCNPGDGILIAAPYYNGFDSNFKFPGIRPIPVNVPIVDIGTAKEVDYLKAAMRTTGLNINAVVLCNPHNPLGRAYHKDAIEAYCRFAEEFNLHLICDEIYAQSVFRLKGDDEAQEFTSVLSLNLESLDVNPARVHVLYSMSKDFGASGFRIGLFVSRANPSIIQSMAAQATFMRASSPADLLWSALLQSDSDNGPPEFNNITEYLKENKTSLGNTYDEVIQWLIRYDINYIPASAGLFLMIDLRPIINDVVTAGPLVGFNKDTPMPDRERLLNLYLQETPAYKVCLSPGLSYHMPESGWFRLVFSVRKEIRDEGFKRLGEALVGLRGH
jgi:1-aminocyclopropane-1-carboxylate synthase